MTNGEKPIFHISPPNKRDPFKFLCGVVKTPMGDVTPDAALRLPVELVCAQCLANLKPSMQKAG